MTRTTIVTLAATALVVGAVLSPTVASADWYGNNRRSDTRSDRRDFQTDLRDIQRDRADLNRDQRELARDLQAGRWWEISRDLADIQRDRMRLREDQQDLRRDLRHLDIDRRGFNYRR